MLCHIIWRNSFRFHTNIFWSRWSRLHYTGTSVYWLSSNYRGIKSTKTRSRSFTNFSSCYGILRINIKIADTGGKYVLRLTGSYSIPSFKMPPALMLRTCIRITEWIIVSIVTPVLFLKYTCVGCAVLLLLHRY